MKFKHFISLSVFGLKTVLFKKKNPIVGSIIITDRCNLNCKHCSVSNINTIMYSYEQIKKDMSTLYHMGVRILFFYGGEPFLWHDSNKNLKDLVIEAKQMGFYLVNVVTNGTYHLDLPEADLIMVSVDGNRDIHNLIRGNTFDDILKNVKNSTSNNICFYMAINKLNQHTIENVVNLAVDTNNVKCVSFNFHTPYPDTKELALSVDEKRRCLAVISRLIKSKKPILNLKSTFKYIENNNFKTPCYQSVLIENGKIYTCGRCIEIAGLCQECGYFYAAEYSLLFQGKIKVIFDFLKTYSKLI